MDQYGVVSDIYSMSVCVREKPDQAVNRQTPPKASAANQRRADRCGKQGWGHVWVAWGDIRQHLRRHIQLQIVLYLSFWTRQAGVKLPLWMGNLKSDCKVYCSEFVNYSIIILFSFVCFVFSWLEGLKPIHVLCKRSPADNIHTLCDLFCTIYHVFEPLPSMFSLNYSNKAWRTAFVAILENTTSASQ